MNKKEIRLTQSSDELNSNLSMSTGGFNIKISYCIYSNTHTVRVKAKGKDGFLKIERKHGCFGVKHAISTYNHSDSIRNLTEFIRVIGMGEQSRDRSQDALAKHPRGLLTAISHSSS